MPRQEQSPSRPRGDELDHTCFNAERPRASRREHNLRTRSRLSRALGSASVLASCARHLLSSMTRISEELDRANSSRGCPFSVQPTLSWAQLYRIGPSATLTHTLEQSEEQKAHRGRCADARRAWSDAATGEISAGVRIHCGARTDRETAIGADTSVDCDEMRWMRRRYVDTTREVGEEEERGQSSTRALILPLLTAPWS